MICINFFNKILLIGGLSYLLTACHTDYLSTDYKIFGAGFSDSSRKEIAIILKTSAYYKAKGISRFPDGGQPRYIYRDISLFLLDIEKNSAERLTDFSDLAEAGFNIASSLKTLTVTTDSAVYFQIKPITRWDEYLEWSKTKADSARILSLKEKYSMPYKINRITGQMITTDSSEIYEKRERLHQYSRTCINGKLDLIPLKALGLDMMKIAPKPESSYIKETIYLKNKSKLTRRAVMEQIISKLDKDRIRELLHEMDTYKKSLNGTDSIEYEIYSKGVYQQLQSYL